MQDTEIGNSNCSSIKTKRQKTRRHAIKSSSGDDYVTKDVSKSWLETAITIYQKLGYVFIRCVLTEDESSLVAVVASDCLSSTPTAQQVKILGNTDTKKVFLSEINENARSAFEKLHLTFSTFLQFLHNDAFKTISISEQFTLMNKAPHTGTEVQLPHADGLRSDARMLFYARYFANFIALLMFKLTFFSLLLMSKANLAHIQHTLEKLQVDISPYRKEVQLQIQ
jgi:hypothetical protein